MPPGDPPDDVPVFVDAIIDRGGFAMTRCNFLVIECCEPTPNWGLRLGAEYLPFLMLDLVGIVQGPIGGFRFQDPQQIESFFNSVEAPPPGQPDAEPRFLVEVGDLWLPDFLFSKGEVRPGAVFRAERPLFNAAFAFRDGNLTELDFLRRCEELFGALTFSGEETKAFDGWQLLQLVAARERFPKNPESVLKRIERGDEPGSEGILLTP